MDINFVSSELTRLHLYLLSLVSWVYWVVISSSSLQQTCDLGGRRVDIILQSNPLNGSASGTAKYWTNKLIGPLTTTFYYVSTKMGPSKTWTNNRIEPLNGEPLGGFDCSDIAKLHSVIEFKNIGFKTKQTSKNQCSFIRYHSVPNVIA